MSKNQELEKLLASQKRLSHLIIKFKENMQKDRSAAAWSVADLESRLQLLENYWKHFDEGDLALTVYAADITERSYIVNNLYDTTTASYLSHKSWIKDKFPAPNHSPPSTSAANTAANAVSTATVATASSTYPSEKPKLPSFNGDQTKWESFKERISSMVVNARNYDTTTKFQLLLDCLSGEARDKLNGIQVLGTNFESAWQTLCNRYDNSTLRFNVHMQLLVNMPAASEESSSHLNLLMNNVNQCKNVFSLLGRPVDKWDDFFVYFVESKLAPSTKLDWAKSIQGQTEEFPKFDALRTFLENRVRTLDRAHVDQHLPQAGGLGSAETSSTTTDSSKKHAHAKSSKSDASKLSKGVSVHVVNPTLPKQVKKKMLKCYLCGEAHRLNLCGAFEKMSIGQRKEFLVKEKRCLNCFDLRHSVENCTASSRCWICQAKHHTLLHSDGSTTAGVGSSAPSKTPGSATACVAVDEQASRTVLLATACVTLQNASGHRITVRALLDSGAERCFISKFVAQALSAKTTSTSVAITGVGGSCAAVARQQVTLNLTSNESDEFLLPFSTLVLSKLTAVIPRQPVNFQLWPHLQDLQLADPCFGKQGRIDCLLSADIFAAAMLPGLRRGQQGEPIGMKSVWGWVIMGAVPQDQPETTVNVYHAAVDHELSHSLRNFWELEEVPEKPLFSDE